MGHSFGAICVGNSLSTIERRGETYLLACATGDLATIAIESIKTTFARLVKSDDAAAAELAAAAPSMIAASVALAVIEGDRLYVAAERGGVAYRQRGGETSVLVGGVTLLPGDDIVVVSRPLTLPQPVFAAAVRDARVGFANDTLDVELRSALAPLTTSGPLAVAVVRVW